MDRLTVTDAEHWLHAPACPAFMSYGECRCGLNDTLARQRELGRLQGLEEAAGELDRLDGFGEWQEAATAIRALKG